jgi:UPF0755 protein
MQDAGIPLPPFAFEMLARVTGKANKLKAGSYELLSGKTPVELLDKIVNGDFSQGSVAIIEGWTFAQMRKAIDASTALKHDTKGLTDAELMKKSAPNLMRAKECFFRTPIYLPKAAAISRSISRRMQVS